MKKILPYGVVLLIVFIAAYCFQALKRGEDIHGPAAYVSVKNWPRLPGDIFLGNPTGIAVGTSRNIIVFHRGQRKWPMVGAIPQTPLREKAIRVLEPAAGKSLTVGVLIYSSCPTVYG